MVMPLDIGILGIQGAYDAHAKMLERLSIRPRIIRYASELKEIDGLIIPGGESTVFTKVFGFRIDLQDILDFSAEKAIMGTCAGLILMARNVDDFRVRQLGILNVTVRRNAFGRQNESFESPVTGIIDPPVKAIFIRAPRISAVGNDVRVCARLGEEAVWVENDMHIACTFHPELTGDTRIHAYFLAKIRKKNELQISG